MTAPRPRISRLLQSSAVAAWLAVAAGGAAQAASPGAAAAKFDATEVKAGAEPGVEAVELVYGFTNTGELPLVVEEFGHSCGCLQGEWDGVPVQPGARGKITARFLTKGLRGTVRKSVHVKFVAGGNVELVGEVTIPEALKYSAQTLCWSVGEAASPKQVDIEVSANAPVRVLSVSANDPAFSCELQAAGEAGKYRITVTPRDTAAERVGVLQVRTDAKDPRDALKGLFALIEKPKPRGGGP